MNQMEKLRNIMFDQLDRVKRGTFDTEETNAIIKLGNNIIQSYNTELKAIDTMIRVQETGAKVPKIEFIK